jgi:hypothetical protein
MVLAVVLIVVLVVAVPVGAKKPMRGHMELWFNLGFGNPEAPCPAQTWAGTIEFDGHLYGMTFYPTGAKDVGKVHHFEEDWVVFDEVYEFEGGVLEHCVPGDVVLAGHDAGITGPNGNYHMSGAIDEAYGSFAEWDDRPVWMGGVVYFDDAGVPMTAPGEFRTH